MGFFCCPFKADLGLSKPRLPDVDVFTPAFNFHHSRWAKTVKTCLQRKFVLPTASTDRNIGTSGPLRVSVATPSFLQASCMPHMDGTPVQVHVATPQRACTKRFLAGKSETTFPDARKVTHVHPSEMLVGSSVGRTASQLTLDDGIS